MLHFRSPEHAVTTLKAGHPRMSLTERMEAFVSRLSTRNNFWHKVCSLVWLPYAFRSGITMKRLGTDRFVAVLPFRRFNRNWYNAMAGAALLGNSEVPGRGGREKRVGQCDITFHCMPKAMLKARRASRG
jgi:hypothetical protein